MASIICRIISKIKDNWKEIFHYVILFLFLFFFGIQEKVKILVLRNGFIRSFFFHPQLDVFDHLIISKIKDSWRGIFRYVILFFFFFGIQEKIEILVLRNGFIRSFFFHPQLDGFDHLSDYFEDKRQLEGNFSLRNFIFLLLGIQER